MEEFILEGEPFKFSYEGVDYTCEVFYDDSFNGIYYFKICVSKTRVIKIFRWNFKYLDEIHVFRGEVERQLPYTLIKSKKYFEPSLIKETLLAKFTEIEIGEAAEDLLNERIKNIKIVKEL